MSSDALKRRSAETAATYNQGNIANLDDAMTRRLIASTVMTESSGGSLSTINAQGYAGRYQAGAQWLVDAGYVDGDKLKAAMKGYRTEWAWADAGKRDNMDKFLADPSNWKNGLSLEKYLTSAELQDKAFKINSDAAYRRAIKEGVLQETDPPEKIAGFLKARHISGYGGAKAAVTGGKEISDSNGTSNYDYYNDIAINRDGLNKYMGLAAGQTQSPRNERALGADPLADGKLQRGERGDAVRGLQQSLNDLKVTDERGQPLETKSGIYGRHTEAAVRRFQQANGLEPTGVADKATLEAIGKQLPQGKVTVEAEVTGPVQSEGKGPLITDPRHPSHKLYEAIARALPEGTDPRAIANVALQAQENGITGPELLKWTGVQKTDKGLDAILVKVDQGADPGNKLRVDLGAPTADLQAMSDHMARQTRDAAQPQPQLPQQESERRAQVQM